jgi:hypothetical protein
MRFHRLRLFHDKITPGTRKSGGKGKAGKAGKEKGGKRVFGDVSDDEDYYRRAKKKLKYDSDYEDDELVKHRRGARVKNELKKEVKKEVKKEIKETADSGVKPEDQFLPLMPTPMEFYADIKAETQHINAPDGIENQMEDLLIKQEQTNQLITAEISTNMPLSRVGSVHVEESSAVIDTQVLVTGKSSTVEHVDPSANTELLPGLPPSTSVTKMEELLATASPVTCRAESSAAGVIEPPEVFPEVVNITDPPAPLPLSTDSRFEEESSLPI